MVFGVGLRNGDLDKLKVAGAAVARRAVVIRVIDLRDSQCVGPVALSLYLSLHLREAVVAVEAVGEAPPRGVVRLRMQLTREDILEFSELWEKEFHDKLSPDQAREHATLLLALYAAISRTPLAAVASHPAGNTTSHAS